MESNKIFKIIVALLVVSFFVFFLVSKEDTVPMSRDLYLSDDIILVVEIVEINEDFNYIKSTLKGIDPAKEFSKEDMQEEFYNKELSFEFKVLEVVSEDPLSQKINNNDIFEVSFGGIKSYFFTRKVIASGGGEDEMGRKLPEKEELRYYIFNKDKFESDLILDMEVGTIFSINTKMRSTDLEFKEFDFNIEEPINFIEIQ